MTKIQESIKAINITDELKSSYLDYAMSVIMGRALPDARDGFKPVHRRVLYTMHVDGVTPDKPFVKSAEIVGKVMGLFHPHGDSSIYNTLVRLAQDWSLRYPLVKGQGNFGGRGEEAPAAMRYTEARMSKMALELLSDIDKETVDFIPNYSNKTVEPVVLPTRIPNLLVNGSEGIAVGMATSIPPHNLHEVLNGCIAYVDNPDITIDELMEYIPAPDFPTGGTILGLSGIREAYRTGRGKLYLRSVYSVNEESRIKKVNITQIPYQVSYNRIVERINELRASGEVQGITECLNLSKNDINIELSIHKDYDPHVIMNQLFAKTSLQTTVSFNMVALNNGKPHTFNLKEFIQVFVDFRREVITRRCVFELNKHRNRTHILEALSVALANIEEIISLIRSSKQRKDAHEALMSRGWDYSILKSIVGNLPHSPEIARPEFLDAKYGINPKDNLYYLTNEQAKSILDMPLARLTGLEQESISEEYQNLIKEIARLIEILNSPIELNKVLRQELIQVKERHSSKGTQERISVISTDPVTMDDEDFINKEEVVITLTKDAYIKRQALNEYRSQRRGGMGKQATSLKEEDMIAKLLIASTTDDLLVFTNFGRAFRTKVHRLPQGTRNSLGRYNSNYFNLKDGEVVTNMVVLNEDLKDDASTVNKYLVITTERGLIKRVELSKFKNIRASGIKAISLATDANQNLDESKTEIEDDNESQDVNYIDKIANVEIANADDNVYIFSKGGRCSAFNLNILRPQSRQARGVIGIKLSSDNDKVVDVIISEKDKELSFLTITNLGLGKRSNSSVYPVYVNRSLKGVKAHKLTEKSGSEIVNALTVTDADQVALVTNTGRLIRINADDIRISSSRVTSGVKLLTLQKDEYLVSAECIVNGKEQEAEDMLAQQAQAEHDAQLLSPVTNLEQTQEAEEQESSTKDSQ